MRITEEMFSTGRPVAQGEVLIWLKKYAPKAVLEKLAKLKLSEMKIDGQLIVGHSETGHHHVLETIDGSPITEAALALIDAANATCMELKLNRDCELRHLRQTDTHGSYILPAGEYIRGIREEQSPEGWRRVAD